mmetsp:Transcript_3004/g.2851  ORF Transcript_3004/g.2851 Transcript_3004/m.2851 type:complete len:332 (+) Transcript_3004:485-1480(+)
METELQGHHLQVLDLQFRVGHHLEQPRRPQAPQHDGPVAGGRHEHVQHQIDVYGQDCCHLILQDRFKDEGEVLIQGLGGGGRDQAGVEHLQVLAVHSDVHAELSVSVPGDKILPIVRKLDRSHNISVGVFCVDEVHLLFLAEVVHADGVVQVLCHVQTLVLHVLIIILLEDTAEVAFEVVVLEVEVKLVLEVILEEGLSALVDAQECVLLPLKDQALGILSEQHMDQLLVLDRVVLCDPIEHELLLGLGLQEVVQDGGDLQLGVLVKDLAHHLGALVRHRFLLGDDDGGLLHRLQVVLLLLLLAELVRDLLFLVQGHHEHLRRHLHELSHR